MACDMSVLVRPAHPDDAPWVSALVPRLHEFGPPRWRTAEQMNAAERADLQLALDNLNDDSSVFLVAVRESDQTRLGFVYAATLVDFFTGERHAHIKDIVVAKEGEGQGCGRLLLAAAEDWAKSRGYRFITLSVFPDNRRALELYEHVGYEIDVLRMLKTIS
jgi:ribosomal protein S18 acetylase RimI-like enzyme